MTTFKRLISCVSLLISNIKNNDEPNSFKLNCIARTMLADSANLTAGYQVEKLLLDLGLQGCTDRPTPRTKESDLSKASLLAPLLLRPPPKPRGQSRAKMGYAVPQSTARVALATCCSWLHAHRTVPRGRHVDM